MQAINLNNVQEAISNRDGQALSTSSAALPNDGSRSDRDNQIQRKRAESLTAKLWGLMTDCYGYKWARQYGDEPSETWVSAMLGITGEQMAAGARMAGETTPVWPPGALEFRAMCLGKDPRNTDSDGNDAEWQHRVMEQRTREWEAGYRARQLGLLDKAAIERNREVGTKTLENLKGMFA